MHFSILCGGLQPDCIERKNLKFCLYIFLFSESYFSATGLNGVQVACNLNCSCSLATINPVCGEDNLAYFSPCLAGCKNMKNEVHESRKMMNFLLFFRIIKICFSVVTSEGQRENLKFPRPRDQKSKKSEARIQVFFLINTLARRLILPREEVLNHQESFRKCQAQVDIISQ